MRARRKPHHYHHTRFLSLEAKMAQLNFTYADLSDMLERYPLKARSTTGTNNATPAYVNTIVSRVRTCQPPSVGSPAGQPRSPGGVRQHACLMLFWYL